MRTSAITVAISPARSSPMPRGFQPIFIAKRQIVEQIVDRVDAFAPQISARRGPIPFTY